MANLKTDHNVQTVIATGTAVDTPLAFPTDLMLDLDLDDKLANFWAKSAPALIVAKKIIKSLGLMIGAALVSAAVCGAILLVAWCVLHLAGPLPIAVALGAYGLYNLKTEICNLVGRNNGYGHHLGSGHGHHGRRCCCRCDSGHGKHRYNPHSSHRDHDHYLCGHCR